MGLRPTQGDEHGPAPFCSATTLNGSAVLPFVIPTVVEGSAVQRTSRGDVFRQSQMVVVPSGRCEKIDLAEISKVSGLMQNVCRRLSDRFRAS
jgi:hypothetical protein